MVRKVEKDGHTLPADRLQLEDLESTFRRLVRGRKRGDDDVLAPLRVPETKGDRLLTRGLGRRLPLAVIMTQEGPRLTFDHVSNWRVSIGGLLATAKGHSDPIALCLADNIGLLANVERDRVELLGRRNEPIPSAMRTQEGSQLLRNCAIIQHMASLQRFMPHDREARLLRTDIQDTLWLQQQVERGLMLKMRDLPNSMFNPPPKALTQPITIDESSVYKTLQANMDFRPIGDPSPKVIRLNGFLEEFKKQKGAEDLILIKGSDHLILPFLAEPATEWNAAVAKKEFEMRIETLKKWCNKKYRRVKYLNWEIMYLIAGMEMIKNRGSCEGTGLPLLFFQRYKAGMPNLVSFGKKRHGHSMQSGFRTLQPSTLADFNPEACNITAESAGWNSGKSDSKLPEIDRFRAHLSRFHRLARLPHGTTLPLAGDRKSVV